MEEDVKQQCQCILDTEANHMTRREASFRIPPIAWPIVWEILQSTLCMLGRRVYRMSQLKYCEARERKAEAP